tara:strand:- start:228 stop:890 length:663 start_codon:yes stop_codon:yes gene_type:complete
MLALAAASLASGDTAADAEPEFKILKHGITSEELQVKVYEGPVLCTPDEAAKNGDILAVYYTGKIDAKSRTGKPGKVFDTNIGQPTPFRFTLGKGHVIAGWDHGLEGLCAGAKATLIVAPSLASSWDGEQGATLNFDVEIVSVEAPPAPANVFALIDTDGDDYLNHAEMDAYYFEQWQSTGGANGGKVPTEFWVTNDKDEDARISWAEFPGPKGVRHDEL